MEQDCKIKPETNKQCEEPTRLYYKEGRKIICLDDYEAEYIARPIHTLRYYVNDEARIELGEVSNNDQKCKECFAEVMPSIMVTQIFKNHRRVDWIDLNEIYRLNGFALVNATLKYDEYDDQDAFYLLCEEQDGYKIHSFSFLPKTIRELKILADPDNKPIDVDAIVDAMCYLVQS